MPPLLTESLAAALLGALVYVLGELGARTYLRLAKRNFVRPPNTAMRLHVDHEAMPLVGPVAESRYNADGERGDPLPRSWHDTARVLVMGGSIVECHFIDQDEQWPSVVQRELNRGDNAARLGARHVHVGNIGRSLVTCEHMVRMLTDTLHRYERLDVVVIMCGASDIVRWTERGASATYTGGPPPIGQLFAQHSEWPFGWSPRRGALRVFIGNLLHSLRPETTVREGAGRRMIRLRSMRANATTWIDEVPDTTAVLSHFEENLRRLIEVAGSHSKRVLIARQPWLAGELAAEEQAILWNFGLGNPHTEDLDTYFTLEVVNEFMRAVDGVEARVAEDLGVEQLDLMPRLEPSFKTYYDLLHFTPAGAEAVGQAVAEAILEGDRGDP